MEMEEASVLIFILFADTGVPVDTTFPSQNFLIPGENHFDSHFCGLEDVPMSVKSPFSKLHLVVFLKQSKAGLSGEAIESLGFFKGLKQILLDW